MAKIEMDITEYKAMEENKKLLENSLKKERGLQEQIIKINEEKNKILEDSKMKVIKVSRKDIYQHVVSKHSPEEIVRRICDYFGIDRYSDRIRGLINSNYSYILTNLFYTQESTQHSVEDEIITSGLDEIKAEIRADLNAKLNGKVEKAEIILNQNSELLKENKELKLDNEYLMIRIKESIEKADKLEKRLQEVKENKKAISDIKDILKNGHSFGNRTRLLNEITLVLKNLQ